MTMISMGGAGSSGETVSSSRDGSSLRQTSDAAKEAEQRKGTFVLRKAPSSMAWHEEERGLFCRRRGGVRVHWGQNGLRGDPPHKNGQDDGVRMQKQGEKGVLVLSENALYGLMGEAACLSETGWTSLC